MEDDVEKGPETEESPEEDYLEGSIEDIIKSATGLLKRLEKTTHPTGIIHDCCPYYVKRALPSAKDLENICMLLSSKTILPLALPINYLQWAAFVTNGARLCAATGLTERQVLAAALFGLAQLYGAEDPSIFKSICDDYKELKLHDIVRFWDRIRFAKKSAVPAHGGAVITHEIYGEITHEHWAEEVNLSLMALVEVVTHVEKCSGVMRKITKPVDATEHEETCCNICYMEFGSETPVITKCGHIFGHQCLEDWLTGGPNRGCPYCRATIFSDMTAEENLAVEYVPPFFFSLASANPTIRMIHKARHYFTHGIQFRSWRQQIHEYVEGWLVHEYLESWPIHEHVEDNTTAEKSSDQPPKIHIEQ
jgi:hypothetical protein